LYWQIFDDTNFFLQSEVRFISEKVNILLYSEKNFEVRWFLLIGVARRFLLGRCQWKKFGGYTSVETISGNDLWKTMGMGFWK
jgi:hypothetical protein